MSKKWLSDIKRQAIHDRDGWRCWYCGKDVSKFKDAARKPTVDPLTPKSKGGNNALTNLVTACRSCNGRKCDRSLEEYRLYLQIKQSKAALAKHYLYLALDAFPTPFDAKIKEAIDFISEQLPVIVFHGEQSV